MVGGPTPSARDIREATTVTTQSSGHQFEIQLGHLCNNRCVFCSSGQLTEMKLAKPVPVQPILDALRDARASGATRVVFLGGEPTLHRHFVDAVAEAKRLQFDEVVIFTNGVRLPQRVFIEEICALGDFTWRISIQGGNEDAHVAVTKRKASFRRIIEGMGLLAELGQRVTTNICVNEESYRSLPDFPALVAEHGIRQLHVDIVRPASTGMRSMEYLRSIMPRYSDMAPYYRQMLEGFERQDPDFDVNVGNLPYCVMPEWAHRIHHAGENTVVQSAGADGFDTADDKYAIHKSQRTHLPQCEPCVFRQRCTGVFHEYLELHGDAEFQPVSRERLRELDPELHSFVLLVEPLVEPLLTADPPAGWSSGEVFRDHRGRRIERHLSRGTSGAASLVLTAPGESSAPAFSTDSVDLELTTEGRVAASDLVALATWAADVLRAVPGAVVTRDLDADALTAAAEPDLMHRARSRMLRLVRRIQRKGRFGTWSYAGLTASPSGHATSVHVDGPEGHRVDLVLEIAAENGRNQVSARFEIADGTQESVARPVIEAMVATLRAGR